MEFRPRNYAAEAEAHTLPRVRSDHHPLSISPPPEQHRRQAHHDLQSYSKLPEVAAVDHDISEFFDPLRASEPNAASSSDDSLAARDASTSGRLGKFSIQVPAKEWTSFKRLLMQRFPVPKMISVSSTISGVITKGSKASEKYSPTMHQEELDDSEKNVDNSVNIITHQEYVSRLHELKDEISQAWHVDDRVASLKLSIKVARLLMDTSLLQFYPTLFVLATDVMDLLGDMVWDRMKQKAEFAEDGSHLCFLPDNFKAGEICSDAKETCINWFSKVGSIRELLPRIYLELSILPCWRFVLDQPEDSLQRLVMMTRGIGDPLASIYCRLYLVHCAEKLKLCYTAGYLITCINDIKKLLEWPIFSKEASTYRNFKANKKLLITIVEPAIEYIMKCIFRDASQRQVDCVLLELGFRSNQVNFFQHSPFTSIILHYLLKEVPDGVVTSNAVNFLCLIECSNDYSFDQALTFNTQCSNYRMLGFRLCEGKCRAETYNAVIEKIIQIVDQYDCLGEYLKIVDAYLDIVLQIHMVYYMDTILEGIVKRACNRFILEDEQAILQSILLKILSTFQDVREVFSQNHFLEILDVMCGSSRNTVNLQILSMATRVGKICDSTTIQLLFEISQALHNGVDYANLKGDDNQQASRMICRFVRMVDFNWEMERHLTFLAECRGAFGTINELQEIIVHSSNCLAVKALKDAKKNLSFVKSCIACSEVTVPSITCQMRQLNLYVETAEVSLLGGLVSHAEGLLDSAITCLHSLILTDGMRTTGDIDALVSLIQKFCSLLVMIPGNLKQGVTYMPKRILSSIESKSLLTPKMKMRIYCAIISLCATISQTKLPYHRNCMEVLGNDRLFFGDELYLHEILLLSEYALHNLHDVIHQEASQAARGSMALEACNCIITSLTMNDNILAVCSNLIDTAKSCLSSRDRYLQSTIKFLDRHFPNACAVPSVAV